MQHILQRRVLRDLKANALRYLALSLMIIFGVYIIISLLSSAETVIVGSTLTDQAHNIEDGRFTVFVPLKDREVQDLTDTGLVLEEIFYADYTGDQGSVLRVYKNREKIDQLVCDTGHVPENDDEIAVEKRYCEENGLKVGDRLSCGGKTFRVCAVCTVPDYQTPLKKMGDNTADSKLFAPVFVTASAYDALLASGQNDGAQVYDYAYRLNGSMTDQELKKKLKELEFDELDVEDKYFKEYWQDNIADLKDLKKLLKFMGAGSEKEIDDLINIDISNLEEFVTADDNSRIGGARDDVVINKLAGLVAGVIIMIMFTYVISVFVIHGIEEESPVIGALYALGIGSKDLILHYLMLPVLITLVSGLIGTLIGFSPIGLDYQLQDTYNYYSVPALSPVIRPYMIIYGLLMPPLTAAVVNYIVIKKKLRSTALSLLRNEKKEGKIRKINLGGMGFIARFRIRQLSRELRSVGAVLFGMFICLLVLMISLNCDVMCRHIQKETVEDTHFEYMYMLKYPAKKAPREGEAIFTQSLTRERFDYEFDITLTGIDRDSRYFCLDIPGEEFPDNKNTVIISSAMAQKFELKKGDTLVLKDSEEEMNYAFNIGGISQCSSGMFVFMDIDSMRDLFSVSSDYYNGILSDKALDIPAGRIYSVISREDIKHSADIYVKLMMSMILMMLVVSALIFMVVMYLMIKVMIDRASYSISLVKVFGYRKKEIRRLYLDGNFFVIAIGAAFCIPLSKKCMDLMWPYFISNVACSMNLKFPFYLYAVIYAGVLVLYELISLLLVRRLNQIQPAEVLKNRE